MTSKATNEKIAQAMKGQAAVRKQTPKERITSGKTVTRKAKPPVGKSKTPVAKTPKAPRTLSDPVANAKLVRMRAKWSAQREEVRAARIEEEKGERSHEANAAREIVAKAWEAERVAYAAYRELLEGSKTPKVAETASEAVEATEETPVE